MKYLDLTLPTLAENLALDEALLEAAESGTCDAEVLRFWEATRPAVVLGRSSPLNKEVNEQFCDQQQIEVMRRKSGGATVVCGPGCLMYCLLLSIDRRPDLRLIDHAHRTVMGGLQQALASLSIVVDTQGICDLTMSGRKVSGNSLRVKKRWLIYHGTLLYDFDLALISNCLGQPQRQPEYRQQRSHAEFVANLPTVSSKRLRAAVRNHWQAKDELHEWPQDLTERLASQFYRDPAWTAAR